MFLCVYTYSVAFGLFTFCPSWLCSFDAAVALSVCIQSSSDEEGGSKRNKKKYTVFNEKTDMGNPVFEVGM